MKQHSCSPTRTAVMLTLISATALVAAGPNSKQVAEIVLEDAQRWTDSAADSDSTIVRSRPVLLDIQQISGSDLKSDSALALGLFADVSFIAVIERVETRSPDDYTLFGRLDGKPGSDFVMVVRQGVVMANFRALGEPAYQIRYLGQGVHVARAIDESKFPPCGTNHEDEMKVPPALAPNRAVAGSCDDDGSVIDMMVVYTEAARDAQGGTAGMEAMITLAEAETNQGYLNSDITTSVRVVMMYEVDYVETGNATTDRDRILDPNDGYLDEVPLLRNSVAADVVTFILDSLNVCGMAFFSIEAGNVPYPEFAYNVVKASCATGNYTFGHELGHNQGTRHDRAADPSDGGAYLYSHGYQDPGEAFRTVMSYDCPYGCPRVLHFSNPDILYEGLPTGVPVGEPDSAHAALSINNTAYNVANFRPFRDCNRNGVCDDVDITDGTSSDCNANDMPDECEPDCNDNGAADECDIASGTSDDCSSNGVPDECEPDCNANGVPDVCDIGGGTSLDCNSNSIPDECAEEEDCNDNDVPDDCDISLGTSEDCNANGVPDDCIVLEEDCNNNLVPDSCDIASLSSLDCNGNGIPDDCTEHELDCNGNLVPDACDIAEGTSEDVEGNGIPDECQRLFFVNGSVESSGDGSSWQQAIKSLQEALTVAAEGDEVWVAAGMYTPAEPGGDREIYFEVIRALRLYGGFAGWETTRDQRDPAANLTVLSGDLNGDDGPEFENYDENSHYVVSASYVDATTRIDGFTITGANNISMGGGGMAVVGSDLTVANCTFLNNWGLFGGGMAFAYFSDATVTRCRFIGNHASTDGGGVSIVLASDPIFKNCSFTGNTSEGWGGGMEVSHSDATMTNCTFIDNHAIIGGALSSQNGYTAISSSIFRGNTASQAGQQLATAPTVPGVISVAYSNVQGGAADIQIDEPSELIWGDGNTDADPQFADSDYHLSSSSPCVNAGDPDYPIELSDVDIDGDERVQNCRVDMGVDETPYTAPDCNANGQTDACDLAEGASDDRNANDVPDECEPHLTILVDVTNCPGPGTGTSEDPFCTIQDAIDSAADGLDAVIEVVVADGIYTGPGNKELDLGGRRITVRSENGPQQCIIDAEGDGRGFHFHSGEGLGSSIEGLTIRNGFADVGGGILCENGSSPQIIGCVVTANVGAQLGGGIACLDSSPLIDKCTISLNSNTIDTGNNGGAGISLEGSHATITDSLITGNVATWRGKGGGILCEEGSLVVNNCIITDNYASTGGGLLFKYSLGTVTNCTIVGNKGRVYSGGMHVLASVVTAHNNVIWSNIAGIQELGHELVVAVATLTVAHCDVQGGEAEVSLPNDATLIWLEGNIDADPRFLDSENGDYHLAAGSPCIDAGDNAAIPPHVTKDFEGRLRSQNDPEAPDVGAGSAPIVDMGALERNIDCNNNGIVDHEDIANGTSQDCNGNAAADECEPDCNTNLIADGCDIADQTSQDVNLDGIPDECGLPPTPAPPPNDVSKNRYISVRPNNVLVSAALQMKLSSMRRCAGDLRRACEIDVDCPKICAGISNLQCSDDLICGIDGPCVDSSPCIEHGDVGNVIKYVDEPYTRVCVPLNDCGDQWFAHLVDTPVYRTWTEDTLHVTDCEIVPVAEYEVRAIVDGVAFTDPLTIGTIRKPNVNYGDAVGPVVAGQFTSADGFTNVTDVQGYLIANQGGASAPHTTWVDLQGVSVTSICIPPDGGCVIPQQILNVGDLQTIKFGFLGQTYVETPGQVDPADCP